MVQVKVGDKVRWTCKVRAGEIYECEGEVVKLTRTTFGGLRGTHKPGAKIKILGGYPFTNRKFTTVALDKIRKPW